MSTENDPLPWFPFYVDPFILSRKTRRMTAEEVGVYLLLMIEQWKFGPIPDEDAEIGGITRGEPSIARAVLEQCFEQDAEGLWVNRKLQSVQAEQQAKRAKRSNAGRKGGNAKAMPEQRPSNSEAVRVRVEEEGEKKKKGTTARAPKKTIAYSTEFSEVWAVHPRGPKEKASHEYKNAVPASIEHADLVRLLKSYVSTELDERFKGHDLFRWIRDERWEQERPKASSKPRQPVSFYR